MDSSITIERWCACGCKCVGVVISVWVLGGGDRVVSALRACVRKVACAIACTIVPTAVGGRKPDAALGGDFLQSLSIARTHTRWIQQEHR